MNALKAFWWGLGGYVVYRLVRKPPPVYHLYRISTNQPPADPAFSTEWIAVSKDEALRKILAKYPDIHIDDLLDMGVIR